MIDYFFRTSILVVVSWLVYFFLLRKETFFKLNRYVLLSMLVLSLLLPLIVIPKNWAIGTESKSLLPYHSIESILSLEVADTADYQKKSKQQKPSEQLSVPGKNRNKSIISWIYVIGVSILALSFLFQLIQLNLGSFKLQNIKDGRYNIFELDSNHPPFSFFNKIFINPSLYDFDTYEQILEHEKIHIKKRHFLDKIFIEILSIFFWFNPLIWYYKKSISNNLEYQTDAEMISLGVNKEKYQTSLLKVSVNSHPLSFTTNYNQSILEKRIRMMNAKKSSLRSSWKYLLILPVFSFIALSFNKIDVEKTDADSSRIDSNGNYNKSTYEQKYDHIEEIKLSTTFETNSSENLLSIANVSGSIQIIGHDKNTVEVSVIKKISASSEEVLNKGVAEIKLGKFLKGNTIALYLDSPYYSTFQNSNFNYNFDNNCDGKPCIEYAYQLDYTVKVPYNTNLKIQNVNSGNVVVQNIHSKLARVRNITGSVEMKNISSVVKTQTITGDITVAFNKSPNGASRFKTVSGNITTLFPNDFSGLIRDHIGDGEMKIDFKVSKTERNNIDGGRIYTVGKANRSFRYETTSGNAYVKLNVKK